MEQSLGELSMDELSDLFKEKTSHYNKGFDIGLSFNELKQIRVFLRAIDEELKRRE